MIARDAVPIDNRNPYKRIDLAAKRSRPAGTDLATCSTCGTSYHAPYGCHACELGQQSLHTHPKGSP